MKTDCVFCRFLRVLVIGSAGALAGAWLAPRLGFSERELIMPATIGALLALGVGVALFRPKG